LGSTGAKAARRTLMKLTPERNKTLVKLTLDGAATAMGSFTPEANALARLNNIFAP